jgi:hypothetical protein
MKRWTIRFITLAVIVIVGLWGLRTFFPSPDKVILARLKQVSRLASFDSNEGGIARMSNILKLTGYFTTDADLVLDSADVGSQAIHGRNDIRDAALAARTRLNSLKMDFFDIAITFTPDNLTATANLTVRVGLPSDKDFFVKQAKFTLTKVDGDWLISRVETLKTFL